MTKAEQTMVSLRAQCRLVPPQWGTRQRLAIALMRADRQVKCSNCKERYHPCKVYKECKAEDAFRFFNPNDSLMQMQLNRVNFLIAELKTMKL